MHVCDRRIREQPLLKRKLPLPRRRPLLRRQRAPRHAPPARDTLTCVTPSSRLLLCRGLLRGLSRLDILDRVQTASARQTWLCHTPRTFRSHFCATGTAARGRGRHAAQAGTPSLARVALVAQRVLVGTFARHQHASINLLSVSIFRCRHLASMLTGSRGQEHG